MNGWESCLWTRRSDSSSGPAVALLSGWVLHLSYQPGEGHATVPQIHTWASASVGNRVIIPTPSRLVGEWEEETAQSALLRKWLGKPGADQVGAPSSREAWSPDEGQV
jgi:hypothetical protein